MPIAVDPDIWAFAVNQMERPDTRSGMEVWFAEIGKHKSQCTRDRSIVCGCGGHVQYNAQDGISRRSVEAKPVPRACSTPWLIPGQKRRALAIVLVKQSHLCGKCQNSWSH